MVYKGEKFHPGGARDLTTFRQVSGKFLDRILLFGAISTILVDFYVQNITRSGTMRFG